MTQTHEPRLDGSEADRVGGWWGPTGWVLGILGGISTFLGLFILFGPDDEYVGIGGDLSWRIGDIATGWTYGLLAGGVLALTAGLTLAILGGRRTVTAGEQRPGRSELLWHTGIFVLVNAFVWLQDIAIGGGVDYAYWVTIPWAAGLATHAYLHARRQPESN